MTKPVTVALVGLGGYGNFYIGAFFDEIDPGAFEIVGAVDPTPERCRRLDDVKQRGIPIFDSLEDFYAERSADLVTLATPIHLHCPQTCAALEHGSHVLCEKPMTTTIQDARRMIEARDRAGKFVAIGYQWSFSPTILGLKQDILSGKFGRPLRLRTVVKWPRTRTYYGRNRWAGAKQGPDGGWILDSPIANATAHYLHNMFFCLGESLDRAARPARVVSELYRANDITNFDTGAARMVTDSGVELLYIASHAIKVHHGPEILYEFEKGSVHYGGKPEGRFVARFADGSEKDYGDPFEPRTLKVSDALAAARGEGEIVCGPEAASSHTLAINGIQESTPEPTRFPDDMIVVEAVDKKRPDAKPDRITRVEGLEDLLQRCFEEFKLPSEMGYDWARPGEEIDLEGYERFPRGEQ